MFSMPSKPLLRGCTLDLVEGDAEWHLDVLETLAEEGDVEQADGRLLPEASPQQALMSVDL
ncbi:hypothetical protein D3C78_1065560 [compost metagenome]